MNDKTFSGSYLATDVQFLLKPIHMQTSDARERERLMQQEGRHYSELLPQEYMPSARYLQLFREILAVNKSTIARHILALAHHLSQRETLVLVSLARAGTPIGVLLKRTLRDRYQRDVPHYAISIIRDKGIDQNALHYILNHHNPNGLDIVFVDGWTGKGVIANELRKWVPRFNQQHATAIPTELIVLADLCGQATVAATTEDYLIPSALLNAPISGLISRSVLNKTYIGPQDFHGCRFYSEFADQDLSRWYVDEIMTAIHSLAQPDPCAVIDHAQLQQQSQAFMQRIMQAYQADYLYVKPGIGEAIRVLLRRVPDVILVRDTTLPEIEPFLVLAAEKGVPVQQVTDMPYKAVGIIANVK